MQRSHISNSKCFKNLFTENFGFAHQESFQNLSFFTVSGMLQGFTEIQMFKKKSGLSCFK